jgi:hypothetical protein
MPSLLGETEMKILAYVLGVAALMGVLATSDALARKNDGLTLNGRSNDGLTLNGRSRDGLSANGRSRDGLATNGRSIDGLAMSKI